MRTFFLRCIQTVGSLLMSALAGTALQGGEQTYHYATLQATFTVAYASGGVGFTVVDETGQSVSVSAGAGNANGPNTGVGPMKTIKLLPHKEYTVTVSASSWPIVTPYYYGYWTASGRLEISGQSKIYIGESRAHTRQVSGNESSSFKIKVGMPGAYPLENAPASLRGGDCSSIVGDKPIWYLGLGNLRNGDSAGAVGFRRPDFAGDFFTPAALYYTPPDASEVEVIRQSGVLRQIFSREVLVDIQTLTSESYRLDVYPRSQVGGLSGELRTFSGGPFTSYAVEKTTAGGTGVKITRIEDGQSWVTTLLVNGVSWLHADWKKSAETAVATTTTTFNTATAATVMLTGPKADNTGQEDALVYAKEYTDYTANDGSWGKELTAQTFGTAGPSQLISRWAYHTTTSAADNSFARSVKTQIAADGSWTKYEYYAANSTSGQAGSIKRIYRPWLDSVASPDDATTANSVYEDWTYYSLGGVTYPHLSATRTTSAPGGTVISKTTWAHNLSSGSLNAQTVISSERKDFWGVGVADCVTTTTKTFRWDVPAVSLRDRPVSITHPEGRKESWAYFSGTWDPATKTFTASTNGEARQVLTFQGQISGGTAVSVWSQNGVSQAIDSLHLVAARSTVGEQVTDGQGRLVFSGSYVFTASSTLERIAGTVYRYDGHGRLTEQVDVMRSVGSTEYKSVREYEVSLLKKETAADGVVTKYDYNGLLRLTQKTLGHGGSAPYAARVEEYAYDGAGRSAKAYSCSCGTAPTLYAYDTAGRLESKAEPSPAGGTDLVTSYSYDTPRQTTVTIPGGATKITETYRDGRAKSVTGMAQPPAYFTYTLNTTGLKVTRTSASATDLSWGWQEEQTDWLGRTVTRSSPSWGWTSSNSNILDAEFSYTTAGQLRRERIKDRAAGAYPAASRLYSYDSAGRLTMEGLDVNNDDVLTAASNDRIVAHNSGYENDSGWWAFSTQSNYQTSDSGTATQLAKTTTRLTNFNGGALLDGDIVVAEVKTTDANNQSTVALDYVSPADKLRTRQTTIPGATQPVYTTTVNGCSALITTSSDVRQKNEYDSLGRLAAVYGRWNGSGYQTSTTYTYHGNTQYVNTRTSGGISATQSYVWGTDGSRTVTTTDAANNKQHTRYNAMGLIHRVWGAGTNPAEYTYDILGRATTLTTWRAGDFSGDSWPTSQAGGASTQWDIEPATGLLKKKTHADGKQWTYTYTALGQPLTRAWNRNPGAGIVTTTYAYYDGSTTASTAVSHKTQELRAVTYSDGTAGVSYTYHRTSAAATVADATGTRNFSYRSDGQLDTETLPSTFYGARSVVQTYTAGRSTGFELQLSSAVEAGMSAAFNTATGRVSTLSGLGGLPSFTPGYTTGSDWVESWASGSYSRSQTLATNRDVLKTATTSWSGAGSKAAYDSTFDSRGLRQTLTQSGPLTSPGTTTLGYNSRGELTSSDENTGAARDFTWDYDLIGKRTTAAQAGAGTTYTPVGTASQDVNQYASIGGANAESGLAYDDDGNTTIDCTWYYTYDAENRLTSMTRRDNTQSLEFTYDYLGRRVRKIVTGTGAHTVKYVWSGWRVIAELDGSNNLARSYLWGADFSNGSGAAGGAGGLLAVRQGNVNYFPAYDPHGNITGYLDEWGGTAASYDYNAFGQILSSGGSPDSFTFGYASQQTDRETGLVYYGMRYYNPKHGNFITRDPIEESGGLNLYAFVGNQAGNAWDVLGLYLANKDEEYDYGISGAPPGYTPPVDDDIIYLAPVSADGSGPKIDFVGDYNTQQSVNNVNLGNITSRPPAIPVPVSIPSGNGGITITAPPAPGNAHANKEKKRECESLMNSIEFNKIRLGQGLDSRYRAQSSIAAANQDLKNLDGNFMRDLMNNAEVEVTGLMGMALGPFGPVLGARDIANDIGDEKYVSAAIGMAGTAGTTTKLLNITGSGLSGRALSVLRASPVIGNIYTIGKVVGPAHLNYNSSLRGALGSRLRANKDLYYSGIEIWAASRDLVKDGAKFNKLGCNKIF